MSLPALSAPASPSGLRRSAMLMRALGAKAASVWSQLSPQEAEQLSQAMQALPEDQDAEQNALRVYVQSMTATPSASDPAPGSVWSRLSALEGTTLANMIQDESPQVIALILSRLAPDAAAKTVRVLPR